MKKFLDLSDKTAIVLSGLCVFHCTALPLILIALPVVSSALSFDIEIFHVWLVFAVIPISLFAIVSGYLHHKQQSILILGSIGMLTLIAAVIFGHDILEGKGEIILTLIGSALVAYSHVKNFVLRKTSLQV